MSTSPVRIGFCGVGSMGQCAHLKNYAILDSCQVVALAELRQDVAAKVAARYGIPSVYASAADMLANEQLDAIVASQPFTRHAYLLPELLAHGKPIFIEKPLAASVEEGEKLAAAIAASSTWVMVGYHKRSDPATACALNTINEIKATGELGRMTYVRLIMPPGDWIAGGFNDMIRGEGAVPDLPHESCPPSMDRAAWDDYVRFVNYYIHQVNLMRHLLGEPYRVTYADPGRVLLAGRSESGVTCALEMAPYSTTVDWQESAFVAFEKGYVKITLPAPLASNRSGTVEILRDPGNGATPQLTRPHLPWEHAMHAQARNFIAAVKGEAPPPCTAAEALDDLKIARDYLDLLKHA